MVVPIGARKYLNWDGQQHIVDGDFGEALNLNHIVL